jgi:hypothetical protein
MKPRNFRLHWRRCYCLLWLHPGRGIAVLAFMRRNMGRPVKVSTKRHGQSWIVYKDHFNGLAVQIIWSRVPCSRSTHESLGGV